MAFRAVKLSAMHLLRFFQSALALFVLALPAWAMSRKEQLISVRVHAEASKQDTDTFSTPVNLQYQRRPAYINRISVISEKQIKAVLPFDAGDGTWGCVFQLDGQGRLRLEGFSTEHRGSAMVVFVSTKVGGLHQVIDLVIDRPVTDGVFTIAKGLTPLETLALRKQFYDLSTVKAQPEKRKEPDRRSDPADKPAQYNSPPTRNRKAPEPDLPRLAD